jgi:hypothetical protein
MEKLVVGADVPLVSPAPAVGGVVFTARLASGLDGSRLSGKKWLGELRIGRIQQWGGPGSLSKEAQDNDTAGRCQEVKPTHHMWQMNERLQCNKGVDSDMRPWGSCWLYTYLLQGRLAHS